MKNIIDRRSIPQGTIHRSGCVENGSSVLDTQAPAKAFQVGLRTVAIAITLAALGPAWPLPVRAQLTPTLQPTTNANVQAVFTRSMGLQSAIQNGGDVAGALSLYNSAAATAAAAAANTVSDPGTTVVLPSPPLTVSTGQAAVIFAVPPGTLTFSHPNRVTILSGGGFFLGTGVTPLPSQGASSPASFSFSGLGLAGVSAGGAIQNGSPTTNGVTITIVNSSFSGKGGSTTSGGGAIFNNGSATIANSTFSANTPSLGNGGAILNGLNGALVVTGSSFSRNSSPGPGGAINNQGTATIIGSDFNGNVITGGSLAGAIQNSGQMVIDASTIRNNRGGSGAGAMSNLGAPAGSPAAFLTITDSTFSANGVQNSGTAGNLRGGALSNQAPLTITGGSWVDNFNVFRGTATGGAIGQANGLVAGVTIPATAAITGVLFSNNRVVSSGGGNTSAIAYGGAFAMQSGTATFTNDTFSGNEALSDVGGAFGGAIANANLGGLLTITGSIFSENMAKSGGALGGLGGAIYNNTTATITDSTFTENSAKLGGAIFNSVTGTATITNSSFTNNSAGIEGGAIDNAGTINLNVGAGQTSLFSGNTAAGLASSINFVGSGAALNVNAAAGGLLDMRDPMTSTGGAPVITETGGGVWALGGANVFPLGGSFSVNGGTLYLYGAGQVPNSSEPNGQVAAGTIALRGAGSSFTLGSGATLVAAGNNSISVNGGPITLANGATIRGGTAADGSLLNVPLPGGGPISSLALTATAGVGLQGQLTVQAVAPGDIFTLNANLGDAPGDTGSLLVPGMGTVILTGANTYSGGTFLNGGTLQVSADNNLGAASGGLTFNGGTLRFGSSFDLSPSRPIVLDAGGGTFNTNGFSSTVTQAIVGAGALTKAGAGTLTLNGINTYSGGTIFEAGILAVAGNGHLGTGPLTFKGGTLEDLTGGNLLSDVDIELAPAGGTFLADAATTSALNGTIRGSGPFTKTGPGTLILTGNNTFSGGTTINEGTLVVGVPAGSSSLTSFALGTGNVFLNGGTLRTTSLDPKPLIINVGGNYTQGPGGTLALGIGGLNGSQYDHVQVGGNAFLNGTLAVSSLSGFRPANLNAFQVLHSNGNRGGQFAQVNDSLNNNPSLFRSDLYFLNAVVLLYKTAPAFPPTIVIPSRLAPPDPDAPLSLSFLA
jgi:autotransporter-associated beta strand protein